ncbi:MULTISPECIES: serine O-acetyltransferase EpsC [unclassified Pseudodesulfovibrio]|uniref:serine O-acetyltransferase EpsC n=1 Tax=unclassified Pseudodesulfovibrio TaxID=2661612 RepID=UPI000FEBE853|nr:MULTISPECIES: serine O-acetyltransferase EpsC [unclassified Pseudodesulfovibrio]MCJ2163781.1 serine acetyltransferase [Pseudodesulfovibrio sp. S3-i]RWU05970.1 serine acetyltransferase [Pseudodesulfovibrio sp. S3]
MTDNDYTLADVVALLVESGDNGSTSHRYSEDAPMPSVETLSEIVESLRCVLFPGYFGPSEITPDTMPYYIGSTLDQMVRKLADQINRGYCFVCKATTTEQCKDCEQKAKRIAREFITKLPQIRHYLLADVEAAYNGDPAAKTHGETIFCYPSIRALTNHRIAHELYRLGVDIIPRIIGEMAHSDTGIDIHPGATIGKSFFIDHGTGTVIGETCIIGSNVRVYQGVTLGAKSFPKGDDERLIKGLPRHPIVEDDVIIYAGATILGRVTIGKEAVIGGNIWITRDVPPGAHIVQSRAVQQSFEQGGGI